MDIIVLCLLPFMQIGLSYYISVPFFLFMATVVRFRSAASIGFGQHAIISVLLTMTLYLSLFASDSQTDFAWDFLVISRQAVVLILMVSIISGLGLLTPRLPSSKRELVAFGVVITLTVVLVVQKIMLVRGIYIGLPKELFIQNSNTLPGLNDLIFSRQVLRPMATFGEPSYCGFVLLSVAFAFAQGAFKSRFCKGIVILCAFDAILLQSLSYTVSLMAFAYVFFIRRLTGRSLLTTGLPLVFLAVFAVFGGAFDQMLGRVTDVDNDVSATQRIILPLTVLPSFLLDHPFGVPASQQLAAIAAYVDARTLILGATNLMQNALFNLLFCYGVFGIVAIYQLLRADSDMPTKLFLILVACFNGSLLSFDKLVVIVLAIQIYREYRMRARGIRTNTGGISHAPMVVGT